MLSTTSHTLIRLLASLYTILGFILFFLPEWAAANFAWKISPWVAMTIGGWCLGNAVFAWQSAYTWRWNVVYASLTYLWAFGILESIILFIFRNRLILVAPLAWLYIITLAVSLLSAALGISEFRKLHLQLTAEDPPMKPWVHTFIRGGIVTLFVIILIFLFGINDITQGKALPEKLSLFTVSAFAMFYTCLLLGGLTLLYSKTVSPLLMFLRGGLALTLPITIAAFMYFPATSLKTKPAALAYIVAYIIVFFIAGAVVLYYRRKSH